ncbi:Rz1-like lysis system protein LysC [Profundibacter sp.]
MPDIPAETLKPCPVSDRQVSTVKDLAALATEHLRAAECANGKLKAIKNILDREKTNGA